MTSRELRMNWQRICIIDCLTREDTTLLKLSEIENFLIDNLTRKRKRKRKHQGIIEELLNVKMVVL
jgi:hypothetical protein